ncbi:MAG: hypothetical protein DYG92_08495 [Leptolyngbya sp. PLA1]|nr:hypothetical protein [Leptolyngbya sp. PLA1]
MAAHASYAKALPGQLARMALYLGLIALLHLTGLLVLSPVLRWTLVGVIVASALVPPRFSSLASGLGFLGVGGVAYFHYGSTLVGVICGVLGAWSLTEAFRALRPRA